MKNTKKLKGLAVQEDVLEKFRKEQIIFQNEKQTHSMTASEVVDILIENSKELRELKKGLAGNK